MLTWELKLVPDEGWCFLVNAQKLIKLTPTSSAETVSSSHIKSTRSQIKSDRLIKHCVFQGKGFPDMNTRMMVHKLWSILSVPVLALVDADPYGVFHVALHVE